MTDNKESLVKSFSMIEDSMEKMWDMWLVDLHSFSSTQEQIENMGRNQLDQNKAIREGLIKMAEDSGKQMHENQAQFRKMVEEAIIAVSYTHLTLPTNREV